MEAVTGTGEKKSYVRLYRWLQVVKSFGSECSSIVKNLYTSIILLALPLRSHLANKLSNITTMITTGSHGVFDIVEGKFVVETSGGQSHQRVSVDALRSLLHSRPNLDHSIQELTAQRYEAQILHYGLPSSKGKGPAIMILLDSLKKGTLKVSSNIGELEQVLKREW
jgi:hypothetical protein